MKRLAMLTIVAALLFLGALVMTIRPSLASHVAAQEEEAQNSAPRAAAAAANPVLSYQGQLTDANGTPISNGALPMTFRLFPVASGGTACWTENQSVNVQNGQFNALLGKITPIPQSCVLEDAFLELAVNGETMTPREMLASVASAVQANTLPADAETQGPLTIQGDLTVDDIVAAPGNANLEIDNQSGGAIRLISASNLLFFLDADENTSNEAFLNVYRDSHNVGGNVVRLLHLNESGLMDLNGLFVASEIRSDGRAEIRASLVMDSGGGSDNIKMGGDTSDHTVLRRDGSKALHLLPWGGPDKPYNRVCVGCGSGGVDLVVTGDLTVVGNCSTASSGSLLTVSESAPCEAGGIISGAYVEANLMTPGEMAADQIDRFERGDLLCWSADGQKLELCTQENDRLVMAVANADGKPIVLGAEPVKVVGPITAGDLLVASDVPGHAMVNNNPLPGTVIGQALEDLEGESGIIKAMIRKW